MFEFYITPQSFRYGSAGKESACNGGRERLPTPVFWPGEFHSLCSPWGCKELDTTEQLLLHFTVRKPQGLDSSAPQKEYVLYLRIMLRAGGREDAQQSDLTVN